jgi:hypothetical protein
MNAHHDKLEAAGAEIADWNAKIGKLREDIAKAEAALADSTRIRQQHVLEAALGDDGAKNRLAGVLQADREAERQLDDLKMALPAALERLRAAESEHRAAEVEWRKVELDRISRCRVAAAEKIDAAFAAFSSAWIEYEQLGRELLGLASQDQNANALYLSETISGEARLAASLPAKPFLAIKERFHFLPVSTSNSLAAAEALYWRLPPVEADKAA